MVLRFLLNRDNAHLLRLLPLLSPMRSDLRSTLDQDRRAAVAVAPVFTGQRDDGFGEPLLIGARGGLVALGSPRLADQPARMPFTQSLVSSVVDGYTVPLGTQKFPCAMSFRVGLSTVRSATARRNSAFSFCRSFSVLACSSCSPPYSFRHR